ncbi:MAG: hypothetical protein AAGF47_06110 [Planctomycetota bacterium]
MPQRWQLDLDVGPLRLAVIDVEGIGPQPYWYLTYRVTNNSGRDLQFAPVFDLTTESGEVIRAGVGVPRSVRENLLGLLDDPLLEDQISIIGVLLQGRENAKDGLVIWPAGELSGDEMAVYAGGFSGETQRVEFKDPETGEPVTLTFRKTYMIRYDTPGSLLGRGSRPVEVATERWIMR